ncbi:hypothetical protein KW798_01240 [Candidatus Parcubacteria bacterium]|nr:hypothetical protein [Candidatus Parcubacteria bacterium]
MKNFLTNPWVVGIGLIGITWWGAPYLAPSSDNVATVAVATTTPNLNDIFKKKETYTTTAEKQTYIKNWANTFVQGAGIFTDLQEIDQGYIVEMSVEHNSVGCGFARDAYGELSLLNIGQTIKISGTLTGSGLGGFGAVNPWYVKGCTLLK